MQNSSEPVRGITLPRLSIRHIIFAAVLLILATCLIVSCAYNIYLSEQLSVLKEPTEEPDIITAESEADIPTAETKPECKVIAQPEPNNGYFFETIEFYECVAPLKINTSGSQGYYFVIDPISFAASEDEFEQVRSDLFAKYSKISFYMRGGSSFELSVPLGSYEIYYATGDTWYNHDILFGSETVYQKCDGIYSFSEDSDGYTGWTLTLYPVANGNLDTEIISEDEFPK